MEILKALILGIIQGFLKLALTLIHGVHHPLLVLFQLGFEVVPQILKVGGKVLLHGRQFSQGAIAIGFYRLG